MTRPVLAIACSLCLLAGHTHITAAPPQPVAKNTLQLRTLSKPKAAVVVHAESRRRAAPAPATSVPHSNETTPLPLPIEASETPAPVVELVNGETLLHDDVLHSPAMPLVPSTVTSVPSVPGLGSVSPISSFRSSSEHIESDLYGGCSHCNDGLCGGCCGSLRDRLHHLHHLHHPRYVERPFGSFTGNVLHMQAMRGLADQNMLYDYDFGYGDNTATLTNRGAYQLRKFAMISLRFGVTIAIETKLGEPALDEQRRQSVLAALKQIEPSATEDWVVVGIANPAGLRGEEAILIDNTLLRQVESRGTAAPVIMRSSGGGGSGSSSQ